LVEANFQAYGFEPVFLTFTFRENLQDLEIANRHFRNFIKRLNHQYGKNFRYLAVVEFQRRGAVHYHCIFFDMPLAMEQEERKSRTIAKIWSHGFIDIERVRSAKRVGPYVCKYLDKAILDPRLLGKKAFFTSHGLLRPIEFRNQERIDEFVAHGKMGSLVSTRTYGSERFGKIIYKQYVRDELSRAEL